MQRRTFFKSVVTNLAFVFLPKWARSQVVATEQPISYLDIAVVVLPESLGPKGISESAAAFEAWLGDYKAGVDAGSGYGNTRLTVTGPNPSLRYPDQLRELVAAAAAKGGRFASLSLPDRRSILQEALLAAGATSIPHRPNGRHVVADLMAHFYSSSNGIDFCYNAAIRIADCRGLASSAERPAPLS
jgi:hypothetical protein